MEKIIIHGGKKLKGKVSISGAKNSILELIPAALLTKEEVVLTNVPNLKDVKTFVQLISELGAQIDWDLESNTMRIKTPEITNTKASYDIVKTMRASVYVLGPLLGRARSAKVSFPGGCVIGSRPIDVHLRAMEALGADIQIKHGYIIGNAPIDSNGEKRLIGSTIDGKVREQDGIVITTHGGTVNAIMAAVLANGKTVIKNASLEPEVDDLMGMLNKMGAKIKRDINKKGVPLIIIEGVKELHGCEHSVMPDRLEAGTYAIAAAITKGKIRIQNTDTSKMGVFLDKLKDAGIVFEDKGSELIVDGSKSYAKGTNIKVEPYPGFPTDMQSQFMTLMTVAEGQSKIEEPIFENRLMYVSEFQRMGAKIKIVDKNRATFKGVDKLTAADVMASDLRAGASLVLAGLVAEGETIVHRSYHISRGYVGFVDNLKKLGADIKYSYEKPCL